MVPWYLHDSTDILHSSVFWLDCLVTREVTPPLLCFQKRPKYHPPTLWFSVPERSLNVNITSTVSSPTKRERWDTVLSLSHRGLQYWHEFLMDLNTKWSVLLLLVSDLSFVLWRYFCWFSRVLRYTSDPSVESGPKVLFSCIWPTELVIVKYTIVKISDVSGSSSRPWQTKDFREKDRASIGETVTRECTVSLSLSFGGTEKEKVPVMRVCPRGVSTGVDLG